jgi:hypothetical protein
MTEICIWSTEALAKFHRILWRLLFIANFSVQIKAVIFGGLDIPVSYINFTN